MFIKQFRISLELTELNGSLAERCSMQEQLRRKEQHTCSLYLKTK